MTRDELGDVTLRRAMVDLPSMWREQIGDEWNSRTAFGKCLFPFWLVFSALEWMAAAVFFAILIGAAQLIQAEKSSRETQYNPIPRVYKNDKN